MDVARPAFVPDPDLSHEEMAALQREIAAAARFEDDAPVLERACDGSSSPATTGDDETERAVESGTVERGTVESGRADTERIPDTGTPETETAHEQTAHEQTAQEAPFVAGVDQAFLDNRAVSAIVVVADGAVVERSHAVTPTEIPYIPGLLAFREGRPILAAFETLETDPDLALFDGSGRIHYRQAGLASHIGVTLDLPAIGVAKRLLCGEPADSIEEKLPAGTRVPIRADDEVDAEPGTVIGQALQTRQFEGEDRYVNPVYVSPGHRVSAGTAAEVVRRCCAGYKLPEPIRLADRYADEVKREVESGD
ncbi:MAG: endonuclease V [Haloarculaceae archaeon]